MLTIIVTTSAVSANPHTIFIEDTIKSYLINEPSLRNCRRIIVCDKEVIAPEYEKLRPKYGKVNQSISDRYNEFKLKLKTHIDDARDNFHDTFFNTELLVLERKHGFALAVRRALELVTTPYVLVVQHDRVCCRPFGLEKILASMKTFSFRKVNYICLGVTATSKYGRTGMHFKMDVRDATITIPNSNMFAVPLFFWFDTSHICRTNFYLNFALQRPRLCNNLENKQWGWRSGDFIEDKLGHLVRESAKSNGYLGLSKYGTYFLASFNDGSLAYAVDKNVSKRTLDEYHTIYGDGEKGPGHVNHSVVAHVNQRKHVNLARRYDLQITEDGTLETIDY